MDENILDDYAINAKTATRRRSLIPVWIKMFIWIFMIFGALTIPIFIMGAAGNNFDIEMYGYKTNQALSPLGIFLFLVFQLKGIVSFSLWLERKWAVNLGMIDAAIGILMCTLAMAHISISGEAGDRIGFRIELLILIPYFIKLMSIRKKWLLTGPIA